jgi:hypothetical protein
MIYFAQAVDGGPIKIGCSDNVDNRLRVLESHYGCRLVLLATREGSRADEAAVHRRFRHLRLGHTEQFHPSPDLMAFIGRPLLVGTNPDAVAMEPESVGFTMKADREWAEWLDRMASQLGITKADAVDQALAMFARARGILEMPPPRFKKR